MPGVRINLSKSGISTSVGPRGAKVTFGPKGTYVNAGIPGTGLYTREKISNGYQNCSSSINYRSNASTVDSDTLYLASPQHPYGSERGVLMPLFKSPYYTAYCIALLMPLLGFVLYCVCEWWMFFCCLLADFVSFVCWAFATYGNWQTDDNSCYVEEWIKDKLDIVAQKEIKGHRVRCICASIISILNFFPFLAMSSDFMRLFEPYIYKRTYEGEGGIVVALMTLFIIMFWVLIVDQENKLARRWSVLVLPIRNKADKGRKGNIELRFSDIKIGKPVSMSKTEDWILQDQYENYQSFSVQKQIKIDDVERDCNCTVLCLEGVIGFLKVTINDYNSNLYSLYKTKYGTPKEKDVKDLSEPFSRTWNYTNQRVVYQYRIFRQIVDNKVIILKQVQVCYIDNKVYEGIKDFCETREKKELELKENKRKEQTLKAEKEREEQKLIKDAKESALRIKESEQV